MSSQSSDWGMEPVGVGHGAMNIPAGTEGEDTDQETPALADEDFAGAGTDSDGEPVGAADAEEDARRS